MCPSRASTSVERESREGFLEKSKVRVRGVGEGIGGPLMSWSWAYKEVMPKHL